MRVLIPATLVLSVVVNAAYAEFPNPGRYGGFVPPDELERLQNLDPQNPAPAKDIDEDPFFQIENDPWEQLPTPFERMQSIERKMDQIHSSRPGPPQFISPRELEMLENPPQSMRYGAPLEQSNVWGDLNATDEADAGTRTSVLPPSPRDPAASNQNYPYGGYVQPTMPWQQYVPGVNPGYTPGPGGYGYQPGQRQQGIYQSPYMYPVFPSPYMMNTIAPFLR